MGDPTCVGADGTRGGRGLSFRATKLTPPSPAKSSAADIETGLGAGRRGTTFPAPRPEIEADVECAPCSSFVDLISDGLACASEI